MDDEMGGMTPDLKGKGRAAVRGRIGGMGKPIEGSGADGKIDFEKDVLAKIEKTPDGREICPYCRKAKTVLRHLSKCKRAPPKLLKR